jgi:D-sedoheptulose 7-phosphate isomerase
LIRLTATVLDAHVQAVRHALSTIPMPDVARVVDAVRTAQVEGRHVYILGNGGSASTATHFACDLSKATVVKGRRRLRVTSLTDNVALMTALANDMSYADVFAEPVRSLVNPGDLVIAISASGNSPNVIKGIEAAQEQGAVTVGLVGCTGGRLIHLVDIAVHIKHHDYGVVEDCHLVLEHAITASVREGLLGD